LFAFYFYQMSFHHNIFCTSFSWRENSDKFSLKDTSSLSLYLETRLILVFKCKNKNIYLKCKNNFFFLKEPSWLTVIYLNKNDHIKHLDWECGLNECLLKLIYFLIFYVFKSFWYQNFFKKYKKYFDVFTSKNYFKK